MAASQTSQWLGAGDEDDDDDVFFVSAMYVCKMWLWRMFWFYSNVLFLTFFVCLFWSLLIGDYYIFAVVVIVCAYIRMCFVSAKIYDVVMLVFGFAVLHGDALFCCC